jgi:hypothetical protein
MQIELNAQGMTKEQLIALQVKARDAVKNLKIGDEFTGAYGAARDLGLTIGTQEASIFTAFYLIALESVLVISNCKTGLITDIKTK